MHAGFSAAQSRGPRKIGSMLNPGTSATSRRERQPGGQSASRCLKMDATFAFSPSVFP